MIKSKHPRLPALHIHKNQELLAAIPVAKLWVSTKKVSDALGIWQEIEKPEQVQLQDLVELNSYISVRPLRSVLVPPLLDAFEVFKALNPIPDPIIDIAYVYDRGIGIEGSIKIMGMNGTYKTPQGLLMRIASNKQACAVIDALIKEYDCYAKEPQSSQ